MIEVKKRVLFVSLCFALFFSGVASAAAINGLFQGKPIIKVIFNGREIKSSGTPAYLDKDQKMVPAYMLKEMGITTTWDQERYMLSAKQSQPNATPVLELSKKLGPGVMLVQISGDSLSKYTMIKLVVKDATGLSTDILEKMKIIKNEPYNDVDISDTNGNYMYTTMKPINDYFNGKVGILELASQINFFKAGSTGQTSTQQPTQSTSSVVKSKIKDTFNGFNNGNLYELDNGQIWKQTDYTYKYSYKYRPDVIIYKDGSKYKMKVDGVDGEATVELIK